MISAVNGDFELGNIYCFRYRVKLNNPLMGTEKLSTYSSMRLISTQLVKLNNPLMGTESSFKSSFSLLVVFLTG